MSLRVAASVGLAVLVAPALAVAQSGGSDPAGNWAAVTACASLTDAARRHDCIDGVLRQAGVLGEARVAREAGAAFGAEERAVARRAAPVPGRQPEPARPPEPAPVDELATTIANVRSVGFNRFLVTTADGAVWEQTDAETFTLQPKRGDTFTIQRGSIGGYRCQFSRASLYRCRRVS